MRKKIFYRFWRQLYEISIYGMNMGPASGYPYYSGEEWIINFVKSRIRCPLPVIFDIGSNRGDYASAVIASFGGENVRLHCFEPSKAAYAQLDANLSGYPDVRLYNFGFGDKTETVKLYSCLEGAGSASVVNAPYHHKDHNVVVEEIALMTLDEFCDTHQLRKIHFMKMDVEGYEMNILRGGINLLNSGAIDFIQFEFGFPSIESRVFFKDIFSFLTERYRIYRSLFDGLIEIYPYDYKEELYTIQNFLAISRHI